jgi:hypothetical protein
MMVLAAGVALTACEETDLMPGELTEAEAADLAGAVMFATFSATGEQPAPAPEGPAATPFTYDAEIATEVECPLGGSVAVSADVFVEGDTESEAVTVDYSMTQVHDGCGVMSENDRQFTLWGAPALELDLLVATDGLGVVEWGGSVVGAVDFETEGREGTCEVALEFDARLEAQESLDANLVGVVCGFQVSRSVTVG